MGYSYNKVFQPWSLNHRSIGVFNFPNGFGLSVNCLSNMYDKHRGLKSLNVPQVFALQDLSLSMNKLYLAEYNKIHAP